MDLTPIIARIEWYRDSQKAEAGTSLHNIYYYSTEEETSTHIVRPLLELIGFSYKRMLLEYELDGRKKIDILLCADEERNAVSQIIEVKKLDYMSSSKLNEAKVQLISYNQGLRTHNRKNTQDKISAYITDGDLYLKYILNDTITETSQLEKPEDRLILTEDHPRLTPERLQKFFEL